MDNERAVLAIADYAIIAVMLLVSSSIGVFFRFSGGKQKTTDEFFFAGKNMSILPVAFSLMATFLSGTTVIGVPSEVYQFGTHMFYINIGLITGIVLSSYIFLPIYFEMQVSTSYEYLERRFGKITQTLCSLAFVIQMVLYLSVVLYAPAVSMSAVTNLPTWVSVLSIGVVCTFYCTLGGMKAVLWTDVFQSVLMFTGILGVIIKGFIDSGGIRPVFQTAYDGGRILVSGVDINLETRYTMWNMIFQGLFLSMSYFGGNQLQVQRLLTVKKLSRSRTALFSSIPIMCSFQLLCCVAGIVLYAHFVHCDPMTSPDKPISSPDQIVPYFIVTAMSKYPGLAGLCICGVFSAALSTVSSGINSLTAVTMQDLVRPILNAKGVTGNKATFIAKALTLFYGMLMIAFTFLVAAFENIVHANLTLVGILGGPVLGIFCLGMLTQRTNQKGVIAGFVVSIALIMWISLGASAYATPAKILPVSVEGCSSKELLNSTLLPYAASASFNFSDELKSSNSSLNNNTTILSTKPPYEYVFPLYKISYMWLAPIGVCICTIVGYCSSILFRFINGSTENIPKEYVSPVLRYFMKEKSETPEICLTKIEERLDPQVTNTLHNREKTFSTNLENL